jgi:hypothetical protein
VKIKTLPLLASILSFPVLAILNDPEGFRGISFGDDFSKWSPEMTFSSGTSEKTALYDRKGDKLTIGGAELKDLKYTFYAGKFSGMSAITLGSANKRALIDAFTAQFGNPVKPNRYMDRYLWNGTKAKVAIICEITDKCIAIILSKDAEASMDQDMRAQVEKAKQDF